jgi:hypothetical protein
MSEFMPDGFEYTDHRIEIGLMRQKAETFPEDSLERLAHVACAEILQGHDETGWSLDNWQPMREFVEFMIGHAIEENGV